MPSRRFPPPPVQPSARPAKREDRVRAQADRPPGRPGDRPALPKDEEDLERLMAEVRQARERLAQLIKKIHTDRAAWKKREHGWEQLRLGWQRSQGLPPGSKVH
jgi:hypothetical protein